MGTGPASQPRGWRATWHRANRHKAVRSTVQPRPATGSGANSTVNSIRQASDPRWERLPAGRGDPFGDDREAIAAARLASIAAMLRTLNPESKVRFLGEARMEVVRLDEDTVLKTAGG